MANLRELFEKEMKENLDKLQQCFDLVEKDPNSVECSQKIDDVLHAMDGLALQVDSLKIIKSIYKAKIILDEILAGDKKISQDNLLKLVAIKEEIEKEVVAFKEEGTKLQDDS